MPSLCVFYDGFISRTSFVLEVESARSRRPLETGWGGPTMKKKVELLIG